MTMVRLLALETLPFVIVASFLGWYLPALYLSGVTLAAMYVAYMTVVRAHLEIAGGVFYFTALKCASFLLFMWGAWLVRLLV